MDNPKTVSWLAVFSPIQYFQDTMAREKGDILLFCLGSWACAGSQPEFQPMRRAVVFLMKHIPPRIAAVQNVLANPSMEARAVLDIAPRYHKSRSRSR
jgi:hypothetical protein